jgi:hypothetical protein
LRRARVDRRTTETHVRVRLEIDGRGKYDVSTGVRFLDHMLELVARHGGSTSRSTRPAISTSTRITRSRTLASRWATRSRAPWAPSAASIAPAIS